jgi:drug/metabolite transporter (DMT)-like permease
MRRHARSLPARSGAARQTRAMHVAGDTRAQIPWQVSFVLLAAIWGCSFWWIKLGLTFLAPTQVAFVRTALGALALLAILVATRQRLPRDRRTWGHLVVVALLGNAIPATLFAYGETEISSILAGIINAATPLATLVVVLAAFREQRVTRERIAGLLIGFVGVLVVIGVWQGLGAGDLLGIAACVGAICCYGVVFPYTRRYLAGRGEGPIPMATGQVAIAAALLLPVAALTGGAPATPAADAVLAMIGLGMLGTGVAYALNYRIIAVAGSTTASTVTYLTPVVAVVVGVAFLGESVSWNEPVGAAIVLVGVAISSGQLRRSRLRGALHRGRA